MRFYLFEVERDGAHYALLQDRPIDGWAPVLEFEAATGLDAIETISQRVAVRQGAEFYAPPPTTERVAEYVDGDWDWVEKTEEPPGAFRCRECKSPVKPLRIDAKNRRAWWALDLLCMERRANARG